MPKVKLLRSLFDVGADLCGTGLNALKPTRGLGGENGTRIAVFSIRLHFTDPNWGNISDIKQNIQLNQADSSRCRSIGPVHAAVIATALIIGKENIGSEINIIGLGCGRAVRDRIAPAIDDVLSPAAGSEKANTPQQ